ncbi:MAG TPA: pyridoxamine 5'-phosphate oxidase family protein [Nitrospirae bacterium]|nr:pyridoxamine 5'-phosphate oxidase family protein [Nitrospirota bacterium]
MSDEINKEILSYLNEHLYLNLATINSNDPGQPHVSTVAYVSEGFELYFATSVKSRKFSNLEKSPKVALTIDEDEADWMKITGLQIEGKAEVVKEDQLPSVFVIYSEKFPIIKTFPANPDYRFIKITPRKVWILDYSKGFAHRDYLEL